MQAGHEGPVVQAGCLWDSVQAAPQLLCGGLCRPSCINHQTQALSPCMKVGLSVCMGSVFLANCRVLISKEHATLETIERSTALEYF